MLRINRINLPPLPRPIFEIQVERTAVDGVQVTVMAGPGADIHIEEFPAGEPDQLGVHLQSWLRRLPYFESGHDLWASVSEQVVARIVQSVHGEPTASLVDDFTGRQILQKALEKLSAVTNTATGLAHPLDESRAKELFVALREHNVPMSKERISQLAAALGWAAHHAAKLGELAERIGSGADVRIAYPRGWGGPLVETLLVTET